jgi:hypothetical protein
MCDESKNKTMNKYFFEIAIGSLLVFDNSIDNASLGRSNFREKTSLKGQICGYQVSGLQGRKSHDQERETYRRHSMLSNLVQPGLKSNKRCS